MKRLSPAKWRILSIGLVVLTLMLGGAAAVSHFTQSVQASGSGGGSCSPDPTGAPTCSFRGLSAVTGFSQQTDSTGCILTDASVFAAQDVTHNPPGGPKTSGSGVFIAVFQFNFCTFRELQDSFGEATDATFQADSALQAAHASGTAILTDSFSGATFTVSFDLTWQGTGSISKTMDRVHMRTASTLAQSRFSGSSRFSVVSGTLTVPESGSNVTFTHGFGTLIDASGGEVIVTHS